MKLGDKIQKLRNVHNWTQAQLAEKAGVTQAYVARIESGKVKNPRVAGLTELAKLLGVPVEVLLDDHLSIEAWQNESSSIRMDESGRELLRLYRTLRPLEKKTLLEYGRFLHFQSKG